MVKVAVAGGAGSMQIICLTQFLDPVTTTNPFQAQFAHTAVLDVATEILRAPIASGKHSITIFTRGSPPATSPSPNVSYKQVDYRDLDSLTEALKGHDVCLSFLLVSLDTNSTAQKNLIHACISAKVRRFSPSEWGVKNGSGMPPYANKELIASYLATLPETSGPAPTLEYCLFQPSIFMDYFGHPYPLSPGLPTWSFFIDLAARRAVILDHGDHPIVLTAVNDVSQILCLALSSTEPWPRVGGMRGALTTQNAILALGKKLRGGEWTVEYVRGEDIEKGVLTSEWVPRMTHHAIPEEKRDGFSRDFMVMMMQGVLRGSWEVGTEWNERFKEYEFMGLEEYLGKAFEGKP
ncbi:unnamed protein product [Periconia digitata]|uniref:NmrA-like domain-containing protein n=1 Tax=Periconia digitata TaxID=1303443 RepID=A0A9W4UNY8_9PLEO|nr:unnamed protein product [Periconia digitata]